MHDDSKQKTKKEKEYWYFNLFDPKNLKNNYSIVKIKPHALNIQEILW